MKKILSIIMCAMLSLFSCNQEELPALQTQDLTRQTFSLAIEEPDYLPQSKAAVTMSRYLLEMYEGDLTATPVKMENADGVFKVDLKKGVDYVCLFWADNSTDYDAGNLKAVRKKDESKIGTTAYCAKVTVNSKGFNGAITLKRAVAELSFIDKVGLTEASNTLTITYPYTAATLNVGDGKVTHATGTTKRTIDNITPPTDKATAFASDYVLAPAIAGQLTGLKLQLTAETEKTIPETAIQANYRTKITGEYVGPRPSMKFTIDTRKNTDNTSDATFIIPFSKESISGYSLTVDWGDGKTTEFANGTTPGDADMTHTYSSAGTYTITITSSQKNADKQQILPLNFGSQTNQNSKKLISLDSPLLNTGSTSFGNCFSNCMSLTTLPVGLFEKNTQVTSFFNCFQGCTSLTTLPTGLFDKNTIVMIFSSCFEGCTNLTTIPTGLFDKNTQVTNFNNCFSNCTSLTTLPAGLFEKNTQVMSFSGSFDGCTNLTTLPTGLFDKNTQVKLFDNCFSNCTSLTTLPDGLFEKNTIVTYFSSCFSNCKSLPTIPDGLFEKNTQVTNFSSCFEGCTNLTTIPDGLFEKNTQVTKFNSCFSDCIKITFNSNIFCMESPESKVSRFEGKAMKFSKCFFNCGTDNSVINHGTAPALWEYTMKKSSMTGECFKGISNKVTNASSIPDEWK